MNKFLPNNRITVLLLLLTATICIYAQHYPITANIDSVYRVLDYTINHEETYLKNKRFIPESRWFYRLMA